MKTVYPPTNTVCGINTLPQTQFAGGIINLKPIIMLKSQSLSDHIALPFSTFYSQELENDIFVPVVNGSSIINDF